MHEQDFHSVMRLSGRFVLAVESIAKSLEHLEHLAHPQHPVPGTQPPFVALILGRIDHLEKTMSLQSAALLAAVAAVSDQVSPLAAKIDEVKGEVGQVIDLLSGDNPDVTAAIAQLGTIKDSLSTTGANLQTVDDALDNALGSGGGGTGGGALAISGFTPDTGPTGTVVSISGAGFDGSCSVSFGGAAGVGFDTFSDDGSNGTVTVPSDAISGPVSVTKGAESATGGNFTIA